MGKVFSQHPSIEDDILKIADRIAEDNPRAAEAVANAIYGALEDIQNNPFGAVAYVPKSFKNEFLRKKVVLPYRNYLVFYEARPDETRVLYVHHGARLFERRHKSEKRS